MSQADVSVVIPMYNAEPWIRETLVSVAQQTAQPTECIVVDDGSTDGGPEVVAAFIDLVGGPFRLVRTPNDGVAAARNVGIDASTGRYVALLDADDLWCPAKLERQVELLDRSGAAMCVSAYEVFESSTLRRLGVVTCGDAPSAVRRWLAMEGNGLLISSTGLIRRSAIDIARSFNPNIAICEDLEFTLRIVETGLVVSDPEVLVGYRAHPHQAHRRIDDVARNTAKLYDLVLPTYEDRRFVDRCRANLDAHVGYSFLVRGRWREGLGRLWRSARVDPRRIVTLPLAALFRRRMRRLQGLFGRRRFFDPPMGKEPKVGRLGVGRV